MVSAAVSPLHAPCSAAPVPIRRPRSRAQWLVTRLSGLRFAVCCDVFAPTVESGVVPVPGPSTLKSPAKGCAQLAQRKHAKRCMKRRKKIVGLPAADGTTSWMRSGILGRGTLVPSYLPSELYLADSCGGECTRGAVVGSRQAAPRTNRTRIDLGRRGREDFFATWRPQWCIPMPWGGRGPCNAVVRVANCWVQLPTQWMGHAIYLGVCGRVRGDGS